MAIAAILRTRHARCAPYLENTRAAGAGAPSVRGPCAACRHRSGIAP